MNRPYRPPTPDGTEQYREWLSLIEVSGPFLSLPVLRAAWPTLDPLDKEERAQLRAAHTAWQDSASAGRAEWIRYVLRDLLGWGDALRTEGLDSLAVTVSEHETEIVPSFTLGAPDEARLLGLTLPEGLHPTGRVPGSAWAATSADRLALLCRRQGVELGLATDGRWWALVWAPRDGATTIAVLDTIAWNEASDRVVVRAFLSLLHYRRFFEVKERESLVALLRESLDRQEEITNALGVQVRRAVELLVAAFGRAFAHDFQRGGEGLGDLKAQEVYRGAVVVMMRVVFLLFAEERRLLPSDNDFYASAYSAGGLCAELEQHASEGSEDELEHSFEAWHRLLALFTAVHDGVEHERLTVHAHDGSLFDPKALAWLPLAIDDRTVLHMLRAVQYVEIGTGRSRERRQLSFATLDVEQIGYVYEGLLSFEGKKATETIVGLIGKEGLEAEVELGALENLAAKHPGAEALAAAVAEEFKDYKPGTVGSLTRALSPLDGIEREEARKKLLAVAAGNRELAERLLPFFGIIRADLRGLPTVMTSGTLYVTDSKLRRNTGTHYTPRTLATEVVKHALQPLVYEPGPLQTADRSQWKHKSSKQILALKVADIAMGSAAFLVAAARYLGDHLIEAWRNEGDPRVSEQRSADGVAPSNPDNDPLTIEARRQIIEHCLYGVDINPMAVEMAKLSLWLVSMDPLRPFTFLDDRLVAGDSLLGITSLEQLEYMHFDPAYGRRLHENTTEDWSAGARSLVAEVASDRRGLVELALGDNPMGAMSRKREILTEANAKTARMRLFGDLIVGAGLAGSTKAAGSRDTNTRALEGDERRIGRDGYFVEAARIASATSKSDDEAEADAWRHQWLNADRPNGAFDRAPLHWPLVFPEVFEQGGFDAVIGNPPFLGGKKISGYAGSAYREYLVSVIASGVKGNADLVAYFTLRAHALLNAIGQTGLIATNTLSQGETRHVGLDPLIAGGTTIRRAIKSKPWPSRSAMLEYCAVWTSQLLPGELAELVADDVVVKGITPSLNPQSRTSGNPWRLKANAGIAFQGSNIVGLGFTMEPAEAAKLIAQDARNNDVLFPYLNGQDLNSRPNCSASRWVINFHDWTEARAEKYSDCFERVVQLVKPERLVNNDPGARRWWWRFLRSSIELNSAIAGLKRVVVIARISKTVLPLLVPTGQVINEKVVVFASDDSKLLALLSSAPHYWWAVTWTSTLETRINYSPTDVFETLALPTLTEELRELGERLDSRRREIMLARQAGLTATYNLVHNPGCQDADIAELREIHRAIDEAVMRAYGWDDLPLDHGFQDLGRETRYTIGPEARREVLDRLLELNQARHAEEVASGVDTKRKAGKAKPTAQKESLFDQMGESTS